MSSKDRREILAILGVAAAGSSVVAAEAMDTSEHGLSRVPGLMQRSPETQSRAAKILDGMAAAIRSGELTALSVDVHSRAAFDQFIQHEVKFTLELSAPGQPVS